MANASHKHVGLGAQGKRNGKGNGGGALSELPVEAVPANGILSNRDKAQMSGARGQDGKWLQSEQMQDHESNKEIDD